MNTLLRSKMGAAIVALVMITSVAVFGQKNSELSPAVAGAAARSAGTETLEAAIRKELEDINNAVARHDASAVIAHFADGEGMYYDSQSGRISSERYKNGWRDAIELSAKLNEKVTDEIADLYVLSLGPDTALANYTDINKTTVDGKTETLRVGETDIFVLRNGRWLLLATHNEILPKDVDPVVAGMPVDWERSPSGTGNSYAMTVDTAVRHGGKASASLRFACGSEASPWGSLSQEIDAVEYAGKRVRLSGWIKTGDAGDVGLWLRADGERHMLAFDNMQDRPVKGTTDWKRYEIVLDIPVSAINLRFGGLLSGKGQAWFDDMKLEIVGPDISATAKISDAEKNADRESLANLKRSPRVTPVNLGFENGVIK